MSVVGREGRQRSDGLTDGVHLLFPDGVLAQASLPRVLSLFCSSVLAISSYGPRIVVIDCTWREICGQSFAKFFFD